MTDWTRATMWLGLGVGLGGCSILNQRVERDDPGELCIIGDPDFEELRILSGVTIDPCGSESLEEASCEVTRSSELLVVAGYLRYLDIVPHPRDCASGPGGNHVSISCQVAPDDVGLDVQYAGERTPWAELELCFK